MRELPKLARRINQLHFAMKRPVVLALMFLSLWPAFCYSMLAQLPTQEIEKLSGDKSMASWFLTMGAIAIISWTWVFRWLIKQLDAQRETNAKLVEQLLDNAQKATASAQKATDNAQAANDQLQGLLRQVTAALEKLAQK